MKVTLPEDSEKIYGIEKAEKAKEIAKLYEEESTEETAEGWAEYISRALTDGNEYLSILSATAEIAGNASQLNFLTNDSGDLDIYIRALGQGSNENHKRCFFVFGFYLTDAWSYTDEIRDSIKERMFIREFREVE